MPGKAPSYPFYVADWLSDTELQMASASTRGIWINSLCHMWKASVKGRLKGPEDELIRLANCTGIEWDVFLEEGLRLGFVDIEIEEEDVTCHDESQKRHRIVTLINRRMYKESKSKEKARIRQQRSRASRNSHGDITPEKALSSSSSSSSNTNTSFSNEKDILASGNSGTKNNSSPPATPINPEVQKNSKKWWDGEIEEIQKRIFGNICLTYPQIGLLINELNNDNGRFAHPGFGDHGTLWQAIYECGKKPDNPFTWLRTIAGDQRRVAELRKRSQKKADSNPFKPVKILIAGMGTDEQ